MISVKKHWTTFYEKCKEKGLCVNCGGVIQKKNLPCTKCKKCKDGNKKKYNERKRNKLCVQCGEKIQKLSTSIIYCKKCNKNHNESSKKWLNVNNERNKKKYKEYSQKLIVKIRKRDYQKKYQQSCRYKNKATEYRQRQEVKKQRRIQDRIRSKKPENRKYRRDYQRRKRKTNISFAIAARLRVRVRAAFILYTKTGKTMKAVKYRIDYKAIITNICFLSRCKAKNRK